MPPGTPDAGAATDLADGTRPNGGRSPSVVGDGSGGASATGAGPVVDGGRTAVKASA
ncbi:hypothetical protein GCM10018952_45390 [Streptosporangium vulgare]